MKDGRIPEARYMSGELFLAIFSQTLLQDSSRACQAKLIRADRGPLSVYPGVGLKGRRQTLCLLH